MADPKHKSDCPERIRPGNNDPYQRPCTCGADKPAPPAPTVEQVREAGERINAWMKKLIAGETRRDGLMYILNVCVSVKLFGDIETILSALEQAQGLAEFYKSGLAVKREELALVIESETILRAENAAQVEQNKRLEDQLALEKRSYRSLAEHHNEHCVCMDIY